MESFFNTRERIAQLKQEAEQWIGTPFVSHACVRGAGVDCIHLIAAIYLACGVIKSFHPPKYALDSGSHNADSQLLAWLDAHPRFVRLSSQSTPRIGDILCFNLGMSEHHIAALIDERKFIHVLPTRFVILSSLDERYYTRRITAIYRALP